MHLSSNLQMHFALQIKLTKYNPVYKTGKAIEQIPVCNCGSANQQRFHHMNLYNQPYRMLRVLITCDISH